DTDHDGFCTTADNPDYSGAGWTGNRIDNNGDGVCNNADAHITGAKTMTTPADPTQWEDDIIPLNPETGAASPIIGLGFSTARPLDIRAGGGEDEVQYNVNAPVSVDGGTGFDKLIILATEFADDIAITNKGVYGAGLSVRYATIEVVEVDGLEGDDQFFVLSTAFGVAYRVIGGLGSDTINVASDVQADIVTRELEGLSGDINHLVRSSGLLSDPLYDGLPVDGLDYNLATPDLGVVVIEETGPGTTIREGGSIAVSAIDSYLVYLAAAPTAPVYVTASAARAPQEEAEDTFSNPAPLPNGEGDSIWLCLGDGTSGECNTRADFQRHKIVNGTIVNESGRAVVLTFTSTAWDKTDAKIVYLYAEDDPRSEGDRVVVTQHSVISADPIFDGALVRNVEVMVRDNDTPGVYVTEVEPGTTTEDERSIVIEGSFFGLDYTGLGDELLIQLAKDPGGDTIVVKVSLDAESQVAISLVKTNLEASAIAHNWTQHDDGAGGTYYTVEFDSGDWEDPVRILIEARDNGTRADPLTAVINFGCDESTSGICGIYDPVENPTVTYPILNLRSDPGRQPVTVIDDETPGMVTIESGVDTLIVKCGNGACTVAGPGDFYTFRLTKQPTGVVEVAVLTDGLVDVVGVDSTSITPANYEVIGGLLPSRKFLGNLSISSDGLTLTRANGSDLGSFIDEGFLPGDLIRISVDGVGMYDVEIDDTTGAITDTSITLAEALPVVFHGHVTTENTDALSELTRSGEWEGELTFALPDPKGGWQAIRDDASSWLSDGFLEGQWVEICESDGMGNCTGMSGRFKIAIIRGTNESKDEKIEFRSYFDLTETYHLVDDLSAFSGGEYLVRRIAPVAAVSSSDWFLPQSVDL
ncbi:MAG: hypothetical protein DRI46_14295, partial [Chloroflexi bacterium]